MLSLKPTPSLLTLIFLIGMVITIASNTPVYWSGLAVLVVWTMAIKDGMMFVAMFLLLSEILRRLL